MTSLDEVFCSSTKCEPELDKRAAEADSRTVLGRMGGVEDIGEEEADELKGERDDHWRVS